ncbi:YdeI/OmpD-associated family protein [Cytophaga aurantiaca]|uniref:YdeI/OmpD-associated family protein n=1 Tax=Cytophaga aurantiaca TaxID=29530 RepID=UPI00036C9BE0|nr:YdeI/OmpD-associated family protein [Cytophaga aurantiaca]
MHTFKAIIEKFEKNGEKTGWSFIYIPIDISEAMQPSNRKGFRVKGTLDKFPIEGIALLPMGDGEFIMPINASMRKGTHKAMGGTLTVRIEFDPKEYELNSDFVLCLEDDPTAYEYYKSLTKSHQNYFSKWIDAAKTEVTKSKRITQSIQALGMGLGYSEMMRMNKGN